MPLSPEPCRLHLKSAFCAFSQPPASTLLRTYTLSGQTFFEAQSHCEAQGARLPIISHSTQLMLENHFGGGGWIGASDRFAEGTWTWENASAAADSMSWGANEVCTAGTLNHRRHRLVARFLCTLRSFASAPNYGPRGANVLNFPLLPSPTLLCATLYSPTVGPAKIAQS